ncbi:Uncharacterised protein [Dermatophilus congolensis]|uniref:Uncharacterized protein n=1 Tax=Dermatophilus congolensis TaxID=1863 RepID=A0AA46BP11_9MICO|nr:Uncharacterised protein [Dermatophilus congolensis]
MTSPCSLSGGIIEDSFAPPVKASRVGRRSDGGQHAVKYGFKGVPKVRSGGVALAVADVAVGCLA